MALPAVPPGELARRLGLAYPGGPLDSQLESHQAGAAAMLTGHVHSDLVDANPVLWSLAVTGLAVKLWDTSTRGTVGMDAVGDFTMPSPSATSGLVNSVAALWLPLTLTGGVVIA
jgi:hypothetical protein